LNVVDRYKEPMLSGEILEHHLNGLKKTPGGGLRAGSWNGGPATPSKSGQELLDHAAPGLFHSIGGYSHLVPCEGIHDWVERNVLSHGGTASAQDQHSIELSESSDFPQEPGLSNTRLTANHDCGHAFGLAGQ
jgi:hypothetical protein